MRLAVGAPADRATLLGAGGAEDRRDEEGWTALDRAANSGHDLAVRRLLEVGARVEDAHSSGSSLWRAACNGREAVAERLVDAAAVVDLAL